MSTRRPVRRYWEAARAKVEREAACRTCNETVGLQAAHVISRTHDRSFDALWPGAELPDDFKPDDLYVNPDDVVPLCRRCHGLYDARALDLLPALTIAEQVAAVRAVGIVAALRRTTSDRRQA